MTDRSNLGGEFTLPGTSISLKRIGASGAVGSLLVQLGRLAGASITAIANVEHATWLSKLGAAKVVAAINDADERFDFFWNRSAGSLLSVLPRRY